MAIASEGDAASASREFDAALISNPDLPEAMANLGRLLGLKGLTGSIEYLKRAAQLNPNDVDTRVNLAVAPWSMGKLAEVEVQIDEALQRRPRLANAHYMRGLERRAEADMALAEMLAAIRLEPGNRAAHLAAARLLEGKGDKLGAEQHRKQAR